MTLADENHVIEIAASYNTRGWYAFVAPRPKQGQSPAYIIIGSKQDGWTRLLALDGNDRYERAHELVTRYNALSAKAAIPVQPLDNA